MTRVRLRVRGERKPKVLNVGLTSKPLLLLFHRRRIRPEKSQSIESVVEYEIVQLSSLRLLDDLPCIVESLQGEQAVGEILIRDDTIRREAEAFAICIRWLLVLPLRGVHVAQTKRRGEVPRVALDPFPIRLYSFLQFPGYQLIVVGRDRQLFRLAGMFAQLKCLAQVLLGTAQFGKTEVVVAYFVVTHGKVRIKLDGALRVRQGGGSALLVISLSAKAVRFQRFERRGGGLIERNIKFLHRYQRLTQFAAYLGRRLAQRVQHFLLRRRRDLLLCQQVAALAIHRLQPQHVLAAQTGNRSPNVSLAARPLAKLASHIGREFRIGWIRHQLQGCCDFVLRKYI